MEKDNTKRFSDRVSNYIKYRPSYPDKSIDFLVKACKLNKDAQIADTGSGTGIFSEPLINKGYSVVGIEPNEYMRLAAENNLKNDKNFRSINGSAEHTNVASKSVDLIVCAQAFHWFDPDKSRMEFKRILRDDSKLVALIWNNRLINADKFAVAYDKLLEDRSTDYKEVNHQHLKGVNFEYFYKNGKYSLTKFKNEQVFDFDGLAGRAFSSSYVPEEITDAGQQFRKLLEDIFNTYQINNQVKFEYETEVYIGQV